MRGLSGVKIHGGGIIAGLVIAGLPMGASVAAQVTLSVNDASALVVAIEQANEEASTQYLIELTAASYPVAVKNNVQDGENAFPVVTGDVVLKAAATAVIERVSGAEEFRFFNVAPGGKLTLDHVSLRGGLATDASGTGGNDGRGGAILNSGFLTIDNAIVENNSAGAGGAIYSADAAATAVITHITFTNNHTGASGLGGAIGAGLGALAINNSTFMGNGAACGGALANADGDVTATNTTFYGNRAETGGGAVCVSGAAGVILLVNGTVSGNTAAGPQGGGGVYAGTGTVRLLNTLIAGNDAQSYTGTREDCMADDLPGYDRGLILSAGSNLIADTGGCALFAEDGDSVTLLTGGAGLDVFDDGGGAPGLGHFHLLPSSPAIDRTRGGTVTDQLGVPAARERDIGAVEFTGTPDADIARNEVLLPIYVASSVNTGGSGGGGGPSPTPSPTRIGMDDGGGTTPPPAPTEEGDKSNGGGGVLGALGLVLLTAATRRRRR